MKNWDGTIVNSNIDYSGASRGLKSDKIPSLTGTEVNRPRIEKDLLLDEKQKKNILDNNNHKIIYNGSRKERHAYYAGEKFDDPCEEDTVVMAPVEVRFHPMAIEQMRDISISTTTENGRIVPRETGGWLGGFVQPDEYGRWYTIIVHAEVDEKYSFGTAVSFKFVPQMEHEMIQNIQELKMVPVGFWHSHPSYQPFQSDWRVNQAHGADVQATFAICRQWWEVAVVIDPLKNQDEISESVALGCYKINGEYDDPNEYKYVGWRSVASGLVKISRWEQIQRELNPRPHSHEGEKIIPVPYKKIVRDWEEERYIKEVEKIIKHFPSDGSTAELRPIESSRLEQIKQRLVESSEQPEGALMPLNLAEADTILKMFFDRQPDWQQPTHQQRIKHEGKKVPEAIDVEWEEE